MMRSLCIGAGLLMSCVSCARMAPSGGAAPQSGESPPKLVRDDHFVPVYPAALVRVAVPGEVVARLAVMGSGTVDVGATRIDAASNRMFADSLPLSLRTLRLRPARAGGRRVAGTVVIRFAFATAVCDTSGGRRYVTWQLDLAPPTINTVVCRQPILAGLYADAKRVAHATLSGLFSVSPDWESPNGFIACSASRVRGSIPVVKGRGVGIDLRGIVDWHLVDRLSGGRRARDRYFVTWEGDIWGPPASAHLGLDRYEFRPTRIIEAAVWKERACLDR